ncbi:hypothetical protein METUNv1_03735 [Methyloversatilis universalis FAM5]|uniref:Uncharacterized protein n=1 Tax=Methyloversatilis universalis (strain ATCC BAA-1314 / DSM 25237 / JCM 13912 / CCUG 52030 / FAM5) TaxID=1000565 RepID=F5RHD8_METUF|nr:hypothetical protein METUNv1_03735 [Methyloversatilis universalis FAM5]
MSTSAIWPMCSFRAKGPVVLRTTESQRRRSAPAAHLVQLEAGPRPMAGRGLRALPGARFAGFRVVSLRPAVPAVPSASFLAYRSRDLKAGKNSRQR